MRRIRYNLCCLLLLLTVAATQAYASYEPLGERFFADWVKSYSRRTHSLSVPLYLLPRSPLLTQADFFQPTPNCRVLAELALADWKITCLTTWVPLIKQHATASGLDPVLVGATIIQESGGDAYQMRVEPAFWARYGGTYRKTIPSSHPAHRWLQFPHVFAASYGLMQVLYPVAFELGEYIDFPTRLIDPDVNIRIGCKLLSQKIARTGSLNKGILAYNGGGRPAYLTEVLAKVQEVKQSGIFN